MRLSRAYRHHQTTKQVGLFGPSGGACAPGDGRLAGVDPIVQQARMVDQERRHAKAGQIADTDARGQGGVQFGGRRAALGAGEVVDQIADEDADQMTVAFRRNGVDISGRSAII